MATVWQNNKIVRLVSTNLSPRNVHTNRRSGHNVIQVNQPQNIQLDNRHKNGVDHHDQMHIKYDVEIAMELIAGFSSRKRKAEAPLYIWPVTSANENNHENVLIG